MSVAPLFLPRRLAIRLLSDAQRAAGSEVRGIISARDGRPESVLPSGNTDEMRAHNEPVWATYRSHSAVNWRPQVADVEATGHPQRPHLVMSLDTKGVLQLRAWQLGGAQLLEPELKLRD